jgi:hypothetical protein
MASDEAVEIYRHYDPDKICGHNESIDTDPCGFSQYRMALFANRGIS